MTTEFPESLDATYQDAFYAIIRAEELNGGDTTDIAFSGTSTLKEISVNSEYFEDIQETSLAGTGFGWDPAQSEMLGGSTGWYRTSWPVSPNSQIYLTFSVHDEVDARLDSQVILDNFRWLFDAPVGSTEKL
jgi:hypothetical protein